MRSCLSPDLANVLVDFEAYGTWASGAARQLGLSDVDQVIDKLASLTAMEDLLVWRDFGKHLSRNIYVVMCTTRTSVELWKELRVHGTLASMQLKQEAEYIQLGFMDATFVANRRTSQVEEESAYANSTLAVESIAAAESWYDAAIAVLSFDERIVMSNALPRPRSVSRMVDHFEEHHHVTLRRHCSTISFASPIATPFQHRIVLKVSQSRLVPSSLLHAAIGGIALHPQDLRVRVRLHALGSTVSSPWLCAHMLRTWAWPLGVRPPPMPPPSAQIFFARKTGHAYLALLSFDFGKKGEDKAAMGLRPLSLTAGPQ